MNTIKNQFYNSEEHEIFSDDPLIFIGYKSDQMFKTSKINSKLSIICANAISMQIVPQHSISPNNHPHLG